MHNAFLEPIKGKISVLGFKGYNYSNKKAILFAILAIPDNSGTDVFSSSTPASQHQ
jgi:hypothetical protein